MKEAKYLTLAFLLTYFVLESATLGTISHTVQLTVSTLFVWMIIHLSQVNSAKEVVHASVDRRGGVPTGSVYTNGPVA